MIETGEGIDWATAEFAFRHANARRPSVRLSVKTPVGEPTPNAIRS